MSGSTYKPKGRGHLSLSYLESGEPASLEQLARFAGCNTERARRDLFMVLAAMCRDRFVRQAGYRVWAITNHGRNALACLRKGERVCTRPATPSVRIFNRQEASNG